MSLKSLCGTLFTTMVPYLSGTLLPVKLMSFELCLMALVSSNSIITSVTYTLNLELQDLNY